MRSVEKEREALRLLEEVDNDIRFGVIKKIVQILRLIIEDGR